MSWSGDRRMLFNNENTMERTIEEVADIVIQSSYTTQPPWCSFEGISCGTISGTVSYASILNISLSDRNLNGTLPDNMKDFQSLETLDLGGNLLRGSLPSIESWSSKLKILNLHGNRFTGKLPDGMEYSMTDLSIFSVQSNLLTGPIPFSLNYLSALSVLKLSYNSFDGNLSTLSIASPLLNTLSLSGNTLTGTFPSTLTKMSSLQYLDVLGNYLFGTLPANIGAFSSLKSLDLSLNALSGTIPTSISQLSMLSDLDLRSNYFTMGMRKNIAASYFSNFTSNSNNTINLSENCLVFVNAMKSSQNANATRCKQPSFQPSSSKLIFIIACYCYCV
jgi:Leucine-rich repeat (LRR) protein